MTPVKKQVRDQAQLVNNQTWNQVQGQVMYQVWDPAGNQIEDQVLNQVYDQFKSKMQ